MDKMTYQEMWNMIMAQVYFFDSDTGLATPNPLHKPNGPTYRWQRDAEFPFIEVAQ